MEEKFFVWDDENNNLILSGPKEDEDDKKKIQNRKSQSGETKTYCPHKNLIFSFKETLTFAEQLYYQKYYSRKVNTISEESNDVVLLQDIKDLSLYLLSSPIRLELLNFLHQPVVDRFLRALILYLQNFLITWDELAAKRAATAKRAPNPLAGGARVQRAGEMRALRLILAREYCDLIMGCQKEVKKYHHMDGGQTTFTVSKGEMDFRIFEGLIQFAHRVAWIALERKQKELMEVEIHRLFRTNAFNVAKRKYEDKGLKWEIPEDEYWILYGPKMPSLKKILANSPLPYEVLHTNCDYRLLSLGLKKRKSHDPRIEFLENALVAPEENLVELGIKIGILGLPRQEFNVLLYLTQQTEEEMIIDEVSVEEEEGADDYETLMPPCGPNDELKKSFPIKEITLLHSGDDKHLNSCRKKWLKREIMRIKSNYSNPSM